MNIKEADQLRESLTRKVLELKRQQAYIDIQIDAMEKEIDRLEELAIKLHDTL